MAKHISVRTKQTRSVQSRSETKVASTTPRPAGKKKNGPASPKTAAPKKKPLPKSKKPMVTNPAAQKKEAPKPQVSQDLLDEIDEIVTKIDSKKEKGYPRSQLDVPAEMEKLPFGLADIIGTEDYEGSLISYLHQSLNLPDFGEVKIQLTLREDGAVVKMVVLGAESKKNRDYLEKNLPMLKFPRLISNRKEETFVLTFCNEL
jgi:hypothetical protein